MPPAEEHGRTRALVWRSGEALLAAPLASVLEIAAIGDDGRARSRAGSLSLSEVPGLPPVANGRRAVVLHHRSATIALGADAVEGVRDYTIRESAPIPPWLERLTTDHLAGLVRLDEGRVAALLDIDSLLPS